MFSTISKICSYFERGFLMVCSNQEQRTRLNPVSLILRNSTDLPHASNDEDEL
jgi:hypothetical protein